MKVKAVALFCIQFALYSCGRTADQSDHPIDDAPSKSDILETNTNRTSNVKWPEGYNGFAEVAQKFENISKSFQSTDPYEFSVKKYGQSSDGRDLIVGRLTKKNSPAKPTILLSSGIHGDELIAVESVMNYIEQASKNLRLNQTSAETLKRVLEKYDLAIAPVVCPDGYVNISRYSNGEDQNRSFPSPQDPEVVELNPCVSSFVNLNQQLNVKASIDFHAFGGRIMYPWSYIDSDISQKDKSQFDIVASKTASDSGYKSGQVSKVLYPSDGTGVDYLYAKQKIFTLVVEIDSKRMVPALENVPSIVEGVKSLTDRFLDSYLATAELEGTVAPKIDYSRYVKVTGSREFVMAAGRRSNSSDPALGFMNLKKKIEEWMKKPALVNLDSVKKISQQITKGRVDFVMASAFEAKKLLNANPSLEVMAFGTYGKEDQKRVSNRCMIVGSSRGAVRVEKLADASQVKIVVPRSLTATCLQHLKTSVKEIAESASLVDLANSEMNMDDAIESTISEGGAILLSEQDYLVYVQQKPGRAQNYLKILYQSNFSLLSDLVLLRVKNSEKEMSQSFFAQLQSLSNLEKGSLGVAEFEANNSELLNALSSLPDDAVK